MPATDTAPTEDTPRAAFGVLSWRANLAVVIALLVVSLLAWRSTIESSLSTAVLLAVGLMNLVWMVSIFAIFAVEKSWRHGLVVAKIAGALLIVLGGAVIARPALLASISL